MKSSEQNRTLLTGLFSLVLGSAFTVLFYQQGIGLNVLLFSILLVGCGLFLAQLYSRSIIRGYFALIILALFFAAMVFIRASELLTLFNILGSILLLLLVVDYFAGKHIRNYLPADYFSIFVRPFDFIRPFFDMIPQLFSFGGILKDHPASKEVIRGSLMALAAIIGFGWLLVSADAVFAQLVANLFSFQINGALISPLIMLIISTAVFIGAFAFMFRTTHQNTKPVPNEMTRNLGAIETTILFASINTLFFLFILVQLSYLFGGQSHLLASGLTYADYARKGFFELSIVAILSYIIISLAEKQIIKKDGAHLNSFKVLSGILVFEVVLILISAFTRLSLYESAYGFTTIRIYSHALMIWVGVILILLAHHIWTNGDRATFSFRVFCTMVFLLFAMNILNPDAFIAKENLARYVSTGHVDATYLGNLSSDAIPYTIQLLNDQNQDVRTGYANALYQRDPTNQTWQSAHLNDAQVSRLITTYKKNIEANKTVLNLQ